MQNIQWNPIEPDKWPLSNFFNILNKPTANTKPLNIDDPIAKRTQWTPLNRGWTFFKTRKLINNWNIIIFESSSSIKAIFWGMSFLAILLFISSLLNFYWIIEKQIKWDLTAYIGFWLFLIPLIILSLIYYYKLAPIHFDKNFWYFWEWRKVPNYWQIPGQIPINWQLPDVDWIQLKQIHAIQLISEKVTAKNSSYLSYELNLVLKNWTRKNVMDHWKLKAIREDAHTLWNFLGVAVWDNLG